MKTESYAVKKRYGGNYRLEEGIIFGTENNEGNEACGSGKKVGIVQTV